VSDEQEPIVVVVADDDAVTRRLLSVLLEREGHIVHTAADGEQALELIGKEHPAVLFLDAQMPPPDGYQLCALVRADETLPVQPVIMMITAAGQETDRARALVAGVDDFITKPFSPSQLSARLRERPQRS